MRERERNLVVKIAEDEMAKLHAIADANDEPVARTVRRWIDLNYRAQFGEATPPKMKLKHAR